MKLLCLQLTANIPRPGQSTTSRFFASGDKYDMDLDETTGIITVRRGADCVVTHVGLMVHAVPMPAPVPAKAVPAPKKSA